MAAILPEDLEAPTLDSMMVGEVAYTLPWGMWVDADRQCWLHPRYPARPQPGGTACMKVERTQLGFVVTPPGGHSWEPRDRPGFVGDEAGFLPVTELVR